MYPNSKDYLVYLRKTELWRLHASFANQNEMVHVRKVKSKQEILGDRIRDQTLFGGQTGISRLDTV